MATVKTCFKCSIVKPLEDFYPHKEMKDGHLNKCVECTKRDVAEHRLKNIEFVRIYDAGRSRLPHRIALHKEVTARYYANFPDRRRANGTLRRAVLNGTVKPQPCWVCGAKAVAHHPDYSQPLEVVWLCQAHHRQAHALVA
jgi:hypothetical protein